MYTQRRSEGVAVVNTAGNRPESAETSHGLGSWPLLSPVSSGLVVVVGAFGGTTTGEVLGMAVGMAGGKGTMPGGGLKPAGGAPVSKV